MVKSNVSPLKGGDAGKLRAILSSPLDRYFPVDPMRYSSWSPNVHAFIEPLVIKPTALPCEALRRRSRPAIDSSCINSDCVPSFRQYLRHPPCPHLPRGFELEQV